MRMLSIFCAASLALAGCSGTPTTAGPKATEERRTGGTSTTTPPLSTGIVGKGGTSLITGGAGNMVAAGAGNLLGADGASLIGADGGSLVVPSGGSLVVPSGGAFGSAEIGNFHANESGVPGPSAPTGDGLEGSLGSDGPAARPGRGTQAILSGVVLAPASLAGLTGTLPVGSARVAIYDLAGTALGEVTSDAKGSFTLEESLPSGLYVVRATVKVGTRALYLSAIHNTDTPAGAVNLDPISTLVEAHFFTRLAAHSDAKPAVSGAEFMAWHALASGLAGEVALDLLAPTTPLADRSAAWQALATAHPDNAAFAALEQYLTTFAP